MEMQLLILIFLFILQLTSNQIIESINMTILIKKVNGKLVNGPTCMHHALCI